MIEEFQEALKQMCSVLLDIAQPGIGEPRSALIGHCTEYSSNFRGI